MLTHSCWVKNFVIISVILVIAYSKIEGTTAYVIQGASQTSTNGSNVASLGCDGDMDTFSLTDSGGIQSWSMTLKTKTRIIWIFLSIGAGTYNINVSQNGTVPTKCHTISQQRKMNEIITCPYSVNILNDGITISNAENKPLKIYEVFIMGSSKIDQNMILDFSDTMDTASEVLDNNLETYYNSEERSNASWFVRLDGVYLIKWFLISIRGGTYELHITVGDTVVNLSTLCKVFSYPGIRHYQTSVECKNEIRGDTIVVKKMDEGSLRLFELIPIICSSNHFGPNCAKCREKCQTCDSITGKCSQCQNSFFGENCQKNCPTNCLDLICDQRIGTCNSCTNGFGGRHCEHQIAAYITPRNVETTLASFSPPYNRSTKKNDVSRTTKYIDNTAQVLLFCMIAILVILVAVSIYLFVLSWIKRHSKKEEVEDNDIAIQFQRRISTHESNLEEIVEDDHDVDEEVMTVEYNNLTSQRVLINQFIEDLPNKKSSGALETEFNDLPNGFLESYANALKRSNRNKNRYKGIYPYDHNCVKLRTNDIECDKYTNASYIHGLDKEQTYIAAQGPFNPNTLEDFWSIVWQNDSSKIVMLTNLYEGDKMKCLKYWPDTELEIGPFILTLDTEDVHDQYTLRYFVVQYQKQEKRVTQFHFTSWPDNSVPQDVRQLIFFRNLVRNEITSSDGPMVVHCSAGIGRTGTFIALDYLLEEGAAEHTIDVKGYIIALRRQRGKLIQTFEQYRFLHDALVEGFKDIIPIFKGLL
nr:uncharacterized protein LOC117682577 [Crassostrea gigas]